MHSSLGLPSTIIKDLKRKKKKKKQKLVVFCVTNKGHEKNSLNSHNFFSLFFVLSHSCTHLSPILKFSFVPQRDNFCPFSFLQITIDIRFCNLIQHIDLIFSLSLFSRNFSSNLFIRYLT